MKSTQLFQKLAIAATGASAVVLVSTPAHAFSFGTSGISFNETTTVDFKFVQSRGASKGTLGVYDDQGNLLKVLFQESNIADGGYSGGVNNEWLGTAANLVGAATSSFQFVAGQVYSLGLAGTLWGQQLTTVFSTSALNGGKQQAAFGAAGGAEGVAFNASGYQSINPFGGAKLISFEDVKYGDKDFNDFTVSAEAVPEPFTLGGLMLGAGGMAAARRRRKMAQ